MRRNFKRGRKRPLEELMGAECILKTKAQLWLDYISKTVDGERTGLECFLLWSVAEMGILMRRMILGGL